MANQNDKETQATAAESETVAVRGRAAADDAMHLTWDTEAVARGVLRSVGHLGELERSLTAAATPATARRLAAVGDLATVCAARIIAAHTRRVVALLDTPERGR